MDAPLGVMLLAVLFAGTHVGLATPTVRTRLVPRIGVGGFFFVYSLIAAITFWALIAYYAAHRFDGTAGLALGTHPAMHALLTGVIVVGIALATAGLAAYPGLPVALFGQPIREPRGIERVTRHPFFAGTALLGIAHALLATHLTGAILMGALALLSIAGSRHQDVRHLAARGQPYADYLAVTSALPFAAILAGRQRLVWREMPFGALAGGVGGAVLLRVAHARLFADGGRWIMLAVIGGAVVASAQSWLRARRSHARTASASSSETPASHAATPLLKAVRR
jgi:uncharacterized membrane protein